MSQGRSYSEAVAAQIDEEVKRMLADAYSRCEAILRDQRTQLETVARYLLDHETMEQEAFYAVFGETPPGPAGRDLIPAPPGSPGGVFFPPPGETTPRRSEKHKAAGNFSRLPGKITKGGRLSITDK